MIEYIPLRVEEIENVLMPDLLPRQSSDGDGIFAKLQRQMLGTDKDLRWRNEGKMVHFDAVPEKYTNITRLGEITGSLFEQVVQWSFEYNATYSTFDPVEIVVHGQPERRISSRMCHDLVTDGKTFCRNFWLVPQT